MTHIALQTTGISKNYKNKRVVDNLDITVYDGDVYGFLGPNGAGKSTTIRMLTGLVYPNSGTAYLMGNDIRIMKHKALKEVGALVESPAFYKYLTARQNLSILAGLSGGCTGSRIDDVLYITGLKSYANDKVGTFSQGMRQRLGIAQALLPKPRLVILDEPTNGLDPQGMKDIRELIKHLARDENITIFLSSHLLHEVEQVCNRVGIINHGKLMAEGTVKDLVGGCSNLVNIRVSDTQAAMNVLVKMDDIEVAEVEDSTIKIRASEDNISLVNRALVAADIAVTAMIPEKSSLEDLFLEMIGE